MEGHESCRPPAELVILNKRRSEKFQTPEKVSTEWQLERLQPSERLVAASDPTDGQRA